MILKNILTSFLVLISSTAFALSEPAQEIRIFSQSGYIGYASVHSINYLEFNSKTLEITQQGGTPRSFGGEYILAGETKVFTIVDPNPPPKMTYEVRVQGLDLFVWLNLHRITVMKSELPVCIKLYSWLYNSQYAKVNCNTWQ